MNLRSLFSTCAILFVTLCCLSQEQKPKKLLQHLSKSDSNEITIWVGSKNVANLYDVMGYELRIDPESPDFDFIVRDRTISYTVRTDKYRDSTGILNELKVFEKRCKKYHLTKKDVEKKKKEGVFIYVDVVISVDYFNQSSYRIAREKWLELRKDLYRVTSQQQLISKK